MKHFDKSDQIIIIAFIVVSIFVLWLISPMGKLYLPLNTEELENTLDFKIPKQYVLKHQYMILNDKVFNLFNDSYSPTVLSLVVMNNVLLKPEDIYPDKSGVATIKNFWQDTSFINRNISDCQNKMLDKTPVYICNVKAEKAELNLTFIKEGQVAYFKKGTKTIFLLSTASKMAYNPMITYKLINAILKDKNL